MTSAVIVGASGGIGRALVERLATTGAFDRVFALSRTGTEGGPGIVTGRIDLADEQSIREAASRVAEEGPVGLAIVASGMLHGPGVSREGVEGARPVRNGATLRGQYDRPRPRRQAHGPASAPDGPQRVRGLSARVGSIGDNRLGGWYGYRASKAALNQILRTLAIEVARTRPEAIIAGLHPGTVRTGLSNPFRPDANSPDTVAPAEAAANLLTVLNALTVADSGGIFAWNGQPVPP